MSKKDLTQDLQKLDDSNLDDAISNIFWPADLSDTETGIDEDKCLM